MRLKKITKHLRLDEAHHQIINHQSGKVTKLEPRLIQLLKLLMEGKGKVISREELIRPIWGNYNSGGDLLTHSISVLRKELGNEVIKTIPKKGYALAVAPQRVPFNEINTFVRKYGWALVISIIIIKLIFFPHH